VIGDPPAGYGSCAIYADARFGATTQAGVMETLETLNIITLYMVMVFATWTYFLDKEEDL
jgi:hypothetical protein